MRFQKYPLFFMVMALKRRKREKINPNFDLFFFFKCAIFSRPASWFFLKGAEMNSYLWERYNVLKISERGCLQVGSSWEHIKFFLLFVCYTRHVPLKMEATLIMSLFGALTVRHLAGKIRMPWHPRKARILFYSNRAKLLKLKLMHYSESVSW